jgi:hypothetical protein
VNPCRRLFCTRCQQKRQHESLTKEEPAIIFICLTCNQFTVLDWRVENERYRKAQRRVDQ